MQTQIKAITPESLRQAKNIIMDGGVVAIPTETVYGLGGNAFDDEAVKKIFEIKGRPNDNPLIAHVHSDYDLSQIIDYDPPYAKKLREAFLRETGIPIVAPSANLSRHVSPTSARHVFDDLQGKIPLILDGGNCVGGIESTVCDCTGDVPTILRAGLVTKEMIIRAVGACNEYAPSFAAGEKVKSPGLLYKHYAPRCKTLLFSSENRDNAISAYISEALENKGVAVLCEESAIVEFEKVGAKCFNLGENHAEMANRLYDLLRQAESVCQVLIVLEPREKGGIMTGVLNRLRKACASEDIPHESK